MDQQDKESMFEQVKSYGEWIELGKQNKESDRELAVQCYEKALELTEDKYEPYFLIGNIQSFTFVAQAHRIFGSTQFVLETLPLALNLANNRVDRLIAIGISVCLILADEYKFITYDQHALEIQGWVKELDPTFDHEVPKTYEDYQEIFKEYIIECRSINRIHCDSRTIDRILELSQNKVADLIEIGNIVSEQIGRQILLLDNKELAQIYLDRALQIQEDKFDVLMKIGDVFLNSQLFDTSLAQIKLELKQYQEALDYINNLILPQESQVYLDIGLLLSDFDAILNEGQVFILKGLDLTANKYDTLKELIKKFIGKSINKFLLQKALEINGEDLELAEIYGTNMDTYQNEKSQETIDAFKLILKLDAKNIYYGSDLERAYVELGQVSEAIEFFKQYALTLQEQEQEEQIIQLQIDNLLRIGSLLSKTNQFNEAFKYFNQAIELDQSPIKQRSFNLSGINNQIQKQLSYMITTPMKIALSFVSSMRYINLKFLISIKILIKLNRFQEALNFLELHQQIKHDQDILDQIEWLKSQLQPQLEENQKDQKTE
ncbi:hypothetical protein pb186bvf_018068 [Paramecium bursaria]